MFLRIGNKLPSITVTAVILLNDTFLTSPSIPATIPRMPYPECPTPSALYTPLALPTCPTQHVLLHLPYITCPTSPTLTQLLYIPALHHIPYPTCPSLPAIPHMPYSTCPSLPALSYQP